MKIVPAPRQLIITLRSVFCCEIDKENRHGNATMSSAACTRKRCVHFLYAMNARLVFLFAMCVPLPCRHQTHLQIIRLLPQVLRTNASQPKNSFSARTVSVIRIGFLCSVMHKGLSRTSRRRSGLDGVSNALSQSPMMRIFPFVLNNEWHCFVAWWYCDTRFWLLLYWLMVLAVIVGATIHIHVLRSDAWALYHMPRHTSFTNNYINKQWQKPQTIIYRSIRSLARFWIRLR